MLKNESSSHTKTGKLSIEKYNPKDTPTIKPMRMVIMFARDTRAGTLACFRYVHSEFLNNGLCPRSRLDNNSNHWMGD